MRYGAAHMMSPSTVKRGILMSGSVCAEDTKTFIAYLDAINVNIKAQIAVSLIPLFPQKALRLHVYRSL